MKRIAIIGSGISGVILAQKLSKKTEVTLFEKANGVGGRMSTRYAGPFLFDHGAQYFTVRTPAFKTFITPYLASGTIAEWQGKIIHLESGNTETEQLCHEPRFVFTPNMNSLCKELSSGLNVRTRCEVIPPGKQHGTGWQLYNKDGHALGYFDYVMSTAPPVQTLHLFSSHVQKSDPLRLVKMQGCYALMLGFNKPWDKAWIAARVSANPLAWISVNSSKPGRDKAVTCLVIHSRNEWAEENIDKDIDEIQKSLLFEFNRVTGIDTKDADYISTHRWRYAIVERTQKSGSYIDWNSNLAATGDWCEASRIEQVWFHANRLADLLIATV